MEHDMLQVENMRYIVFLLDTKHGQHDGCVFAKLEDARHFLRENYEEGFYTKAVIGNFYLEENRRELPITLIDTVGWKKNPLQTNLFT